MFSVALRVSLAVLPLALSDQREDASREQYRRASQRFIHFEEQPGPADAENAKLAAGDVKCDVCSVILKDVLAEFVHDATLELVLEKLEAIVDEIDDERMPTPGTAAYVQLHKTGCNKLFKENYLAAGWTTVTCHKLAEGQDETTLAEDRAPWACAQKSRSSPNRTLWETYSVPHESLFYACEATIGRHTDEIAEVIVSGLQEGKNLTELAPAVCRAEGRCTDRKPSESPEARVKGVIENKIRANERLDAIIEMAKKNGLLKEGWENEGLDDLMKDLTQAPEKKPEEERKQPQAKRRRRKSKNRGTSSAEL